VHVIVPADPDAEPGRIDVDDGIHWIGWLTGARPALCGYTARIQPSTYRVLATVFLDD
jgi:hypothetical protein